MVDKIAIQRSVPGQGFAFLASPERSARVDQRIKEAAVESTDLIPVNRKLTNGRVHFTEEVIEALSFISATEVPGLAAEIGSNDITLERMIKKSRLRGVRVRFLGDQVQIDLPITVKPGCRAVCVAKGVQERVRKNIENMTGLSVAAVNVHVACIQIAQGTGNML